MGLGRWVDQSRPGFLRGARDGALLILVPAPISMVVILATEGFGYSATTVVASTTAYVCAMTALAAVSALAVGLHRYLIARAAVIGRAEPADILRRERRATLFGAATTLVVAGALSVAAGMVAAATGQHLGQRVAATLGIPVVIRPIFDGLPELRRNATVDWGPLTLVAALLLVVAVLLTSRWPRYVVAKVLLWATGQLPLRLEAFLADARDKGLLRAGVAGYEFWHVALQERLVERGTDVRMGRPAVRAAALWLSAATVVCAVVVVDLTQPAPCPPTGLPHADSTLFTVVDADGTSQCAAELGAADVAELLGGVPLTGAREVLALDRMTRDGEVGVAVLGQFSDMAPGTFAAVAKGMQSAGRSGAAPYALYTLPRNTPLAEPAILLLWSEIGPRSRVEPDPATFFVLRSDGSVLVMGRGMPSQTTKDPVEIARAAVENEVGPRSELPAEAVLDGLDDAECVQLREDRIKGRRIDLRGRTLGPDVLDMLNECGSTSIVVDQPISPGYQGIDLHYVTDESIQKARQCQQAMPSWEGVSAAACTVVQLTRGIYRASRW